MGYREGIEPLGESLLARAKGNNDRNRKRVKRDQRNMLLIGLAGKIGNAVLSSKADKWAKNEKNVKASLQSRSVLNQVSKDQEMWAKLQDEPDHLFDSYKSQILEQVGSETPNYEPVQTERMISPIARAMANEDAEFLKKRVDAGQNLHTVSGGDVDFVAKELKKSKPRNVGQYLAGLFTGDDDRDIDIIQEKFGSNYEDYRTLLSAGVDRQKSLELLEAFEGREIPKDIKVEYETRYTTDRWGNESKRSIPVVKDNITGSIITGAKAGIPPSNAAASPLGDPRNSRGPKITDYEIPSDRIAALASTHALGVSPELKAHSEHVRINIAGRDPKKISPDMVKSDNAKIFANVFRAQEKLQDEYSMDVKQAENFAVNMNAMNDKLMYEKEPSPKMATLLGNGETINPLLGLLTLEEIRDNNARLNTNGKHWDNLQTKLINKLQNPEVVDRLFSNMSQTDRNHLLKDYVSKSPIFQMPLPKGRVTGQPEFLKGFNAAGEPVMVSGKNATLGNLLLSKAELDIVDYELQSAEDLEAQKRSESLRQKFNEQPMPRFK